MTDEYQAPTWASAALKLLSVVLVVVACVQGVRLIGDLRQETTTVLEAGDRIELWVAPYGHEHVVELPTASVMVQVDTPVSELDSEFTNNPRLSDLPLLGAPEGGSLVPVSWRLIGSHGGYVADLKTPVVVSLVLGDERITLTEADFGTKKESIAAYEGKEELFVTERRLDLDDITVEVEYDGLTQVLDPSSGEVDAGAAETLYEPPATLTAQCPDVGCWVRNSERDSEFQVESGRFSVDQVTLSPYDPELGWAKEGDLWVTAMVTVSDGWRLTRQGGEQEPNRLSAPEVRLDGTKPVRTHALTGRIGYVHGQVVFRVSEDTIPKLMTMSQVYDFADGSDLTVTGRSRITRTAA